MRATLWIAASGFLLASGSAYAGTGLPIEHDDTADDLAEASPSRLDVIITDQGPQISAHDLSEMQSAEASPQEKAGARSYAVTVDAAALAAPASASDPTQPEVTNPAPAIAFHGSGRAEAEDLNADPTQPRTETAAPAVALRGFGDEAVASAILNDEPMTSAVPEPAAPSRVATK